ncbi:MAG: DNA gyrase C-terminal beta-propeller domain-containing protein, partial [Leptolyngbyaceae bacterium]|nr:DNA gyrase C-terminal beta-propeller domain-containing protein [Leptolyngbyaceae bacterium]
WVLVITTGGLGKRVPVSQFRLQNRAGLGVRAIKFRKPNDCLAALRIVGDQDEMILVTTRGVIIRQAVNAISCQSRMATGVSVQRLDDDDAIVAVALVPPVEEEEAVAAEIDSEEELNARLAAMAGEEEGCDDDDSLAESTEEAIADDAEPSADEDE